MAVVEQINQEEQPQQQEKRLKYLGFVLAGATRAVVCASSLYGYAKEHAGPIKPSVEAAEGTVKAVVGPVVEKFHDAPLELLGLVDSKVDESVQELDRCLPSQVKDAYTAVQKAPEVARSVVGQVQKAGVMGSAAGVARAAYTRCEPAVKGLYAKYEPVAERFAVATWHSLNQLPLFPHVARVLVPSAAYWSEKYNQAVFYSAERGYSVSAYLPLVPIERIAKVFGSEGEVPVEVAAASE